MLLRFSVSNYLSIRDTQELSMVATSLKDRDDGLIDLPGMAKTRAVPAAIVFGPNASGKSNLLLALGFMREQVLDSHRKGGPDTPIDRIAYALNQHCKAEPTVLEADFIVDDVRYTYGFAATNISFEGEWLFAYPHGTRRRLFERTSSSEIEFGPALKGQRHIMAELMRSNSLYLSVAAQNKHPELTKIVNFFSNITREIAIDSSSNYLSTQQQKITIDKRSIDFLKLLNTGVVEYRSSESEITDEMRNMSRNIFRIILADSERKFDEETFQKEFLISNNVLELGHRAEDGSVEYLPIGLESTGTIRMLGMLDRCFLALDNGTLMVIDEIDASLHTQICEAIVYLFADKRINTKGAQLIATTHDTNLLRSEYLRRDQIWLTEKDDQGATELFSLADIKTRAGDNFELGYLQGRYGAVQFTGPVSDLFAAH